MQATHDPCHDNQHRASRPHEPSRLHDAIRMGRLAESFRCLEYKPGVRPFDAGALAAWACSGEAMPAEAQAAAFVLEVASMITIWEGVPPFSVHVAIPLWSRDDRAAFAAWAKEPWFA